LPVIAIDARLIGGSNTGDSTYWSGLLFGLSQLERSLRVVLLSNKEKPKLPWLSDFEWHVVPAASSRWWSLVAFPLAARRLGAKVIHTQYTLSPMAGKGGVTTIHDVSFYIGPQWFRPKDRMLLQRSIPSSARRAARVLAVSETDKEEIQEFVPSARGKVVVTPNACPPWINPVERSQACARAAELGLEGPFVLTVGTRWPRKNMELAVNAMSHLPSSLPHKLAITGKAGWGDSELGARGLSTGYVSNEDLCALYSAAALYLAPSRHEGFGVPVLEAFRCGCPVLSSAGGALPEVVGNGGLIEHSWDAKVWASRIEGLLQDHSKLAELRARGLEREKLFTWSDCARKTMEVYEEISSDQP
jgi:glycosyltransferase involved in cell wall biosynthesis